MVELSVVYTTLAAYVFRTIVVVVNAIAATSKQELTMMVAFRCCIALPDNDQGQPCCRG
jgi:hypothetical protein